MANLVRLYNKDDITLYPSVSVDNLVAGVGDATPVAVPVLDSRGLIPTSYLPLAVDDVVELLAMMAYGSNLPTAPAVGDNVFMEAGTDTKGNAVAAKILTCIAAGTWPSSGSAPEKGKIYINLMDEEIYRWSGTLMSKISKQVSVTQAVRAASAAATNIVPSEKAVRAAIDTGLSTKAAQSHTHNKSQIIDFPTSLKNPNSLIIKLNGGTAEGTNQITYDGVAQRTINITAVNIAAAEVLHTHAIADIASLQAALNAKAESSHTHTVTNVTGLQAALDAKQAKLTAGTNISFSGNMINCTYTLPTATSTGIGGVRIGAPGSVPNFL